VKRIKFSKDNNIIKALEVTKADLNMIKEKCSYVIIGEADENNLKDMKDDEIVGVILGNVDNIIEDMNNLCPVIISEDTKPVLGNAIPICQDSRDLKKWLFPSLPTVYDDTSILNTFTILSALTGSNKEELDRLIKSTGNVELATTELMDTVRDGDTQKLKDKFTDLIKVISDTDCKLEIVENPKCWFINKEFYS